MSAVTMSKEGAVRRPQNVYEHCPVYVQVTEAGGKLSTTITTSHVYFYLACIEVFKLKFRQSIYVMTTSP